MKGISEEDDVNVKKYLRGEAANLEVRIFQGFYHYNLSTCVFLFWIIVISTYNIFLLQVVKDKKLKGKLAVGEELIGKSAQVAAKAEKVSLDML